MARKRRRGQRIWKTLGVTMVRKDHLLTEEIARALDLRPGTMGRSIVLHAVSCLAEMRAELGDEHFRTYVATHGVVRAIENYRGRRPDGSLPGRRFDELPGIRPTEPLPLPAGVADHV